MKKAGSCPPGNRITLGDTWLSLEIPKIMNSAAYRNDGATPHWRGIYDDHGRIMVAMSFNSDIGDSWEWADDPGYPERYSALGIRIGVNYVVYAMTH